ncbi:helix-turn-helix domain-containing protein [Enterobacter ludwigii]
MFRTEGIIDEITQWIDSNLHKPLKIEDKDKKLRLAAKDLIETNEPVINIAFKYGFDSQQTFTRVFSKKYKLPPLKYRNTERIRNMYLCSRFMAQSGRANKVEGPM